MFICLPDVPDTLAVFGSGKGASLLPDCHWVKTSEIVYFYWGDCDEAGYGILSDLRRTFPQVQSLLMDRQLGLSGNTSLSPVKRDTTASFSYLTADEKLALAEVLAGPWML